MALADGLGDCMAAAACHACTSPLSAACPLCTGRGDEFRLRAGLPLCDDAAEEEEAEAEAVALEFAAAVCCLSSLLSLLAVDPPRLRPSPMCAGCCASTAPSMASCAMLQCVA